MGTSPPLDHLLVCRDARCSLFTARPDSRFRSACAADHTTVSGLSEPVIIYEYVLSSTVTADLQLKVSHFVHNFLSYMLFRFKSSLYVASVGNYRGKI